jgi:hypothetical protein
MGVGGDPALLGGGVTQRAVPGVGPIGQRRHPPGAGLVSSCVVSNRPGRAAPARREVLLWCVD